MGKWIGFDMGMHHNFAKVEQCKHVGEWDRCQCSLEELNQHKQAVQKKFAKINKKLVLFLPHFH